MVDQPVQSFRVSSHTVAFDLKRSSSPLSTVAFVGSEEPSKSDDKLMAGREGCKRGKCGTVELGA